MLTEKIQEVEDIVPDEETLNQPDENYQFTDGYIDPDDSLEEFLEDFRRPKEETGVKEQPDEQDYEEDEDPIAAETAKYTASFIVDVSDEVLAHALAFYSLNPVDEHRAGKEQKKHLKKLWTEYCKEKALEIPVGTQIIITMASVYASQLPKAYADRKTNLKLEQLKEDEERMAIDKKLFELEKEKFRQKQKAKADTKDGE